MNATIEKPRAAKAKKPTSAASDLSPATEAYEKNSAWREPVRRALAEIYGDLDELVDPVGTPAPRGFIVELLVHARGGVGALLLQENDGPDWCDQCRTLGELLWARDSLVAASKLVALDATDTSDLPASSVDLLRDRIAAVCHALEEPELSSLLAKLTPDASRSLAGQRSPSAPDASEREFLFREATLINLLVEWCLEARTILDAVSGHATPGSQLEEELKKRDIRYNLDWLSARMNEAIALVLDYQWTAINRLAKGVA